MSSLPGVFSLVKIRSKLFFRAITSAAALSVACWIAHAAGSRMSRSRVTICESLPTTSAVRSRNYSLHPPPNPQCWRWFPDLILVQVTVFGCRPLPHHSVLVQHRED